MEGLYIVLMGVILYFLLEIKRKNYYKKVYEKRSRSLMLFEKISSNIDKAKNYTELHNCFDWVKRVEFELSPRHVQKLLCRIRNKEKQLTQDLSDIMGHPIGKFQ